MPEVGNPESAQRQPHAVLDLASRNGKALKIERLLNLQSRKQPLRLLEIGTGSGGIARYFATHPTLQCQVDAVDVVDNRLVGDGYRYQQVAGVELPFADMSFDVVISNHVIEHVGDAEAQREHLREVRRVLRDDGVAYLAVPNRWMLMEPHFKLWFLSWLPMPLSHVYVRIARKGTHYDCRPFTCGRLERMLVETGFVYSQHTGDALRLTFELERPDSPLYRHVLRHVPDALYTAVRRAFPTLIYTLRPR